MLNQLGRNVSSLIQIGVRKEQSFRDAHTVKDRLNMSWREYLAQSASTLEQAHIETLSDD